MTKNSGKNISKNLSGNGIQKLLDHTKWSATDLPKTASKKAVHKTPAVPLDGAHLVAVRGLIQQEVPTRVRQWEEINWALQLKSSDQQIFSTMSSPESTLIRQDQKGLL